MENDFFDYIIDCFRINLFGIIIFLMGLRFVIDSAGFKKNGAHLSGKVIKIVPMGLRAAAPIVEFEFNEKILRSPGITHLTIPKENANVRIYYNPGKNPDCVLITSSILDIIRIIMCIVGTLIIALSFWLFYNYSSDEIAKGIYTDKIVQVLPLLIASLVMTLISAFLIFKISFTPKRLGTVIVSKEKNS